MKKNIVIFGGGSHCKCLIDIIEITNQFTIVGIVDSLNPIGSEIDGYKVIGRQNNLVKLTSEFAIDGGIIAIGDNYSRSLVEKEILNQIAGFTFFNIIHPSAIISKKVKIGYGNVIMPGVIINVGVEIKNHCIINTGSQLEHFSKMENYSSISAGVTTGGYILFKEYSAIALGVTIFDRVVIGFNSVVGSGSLVTKDIGDNVLAYGSPAKEVKKRMLNERFLK